MKGSRNLKIVQAQEHLFSESVARTWRVFFFDNYIVKDKTKIKTNFPYQQTLLTIRNEGGLNYASDGV